jgi:transcriptional regulator with XRE-family HTH domain
MNNELMALLGTELVKVGARLRKMRKERGWTLEDLAERTGLSKSYLSRIESGEAEPSLATLFSAARAHGVSFSSLFELEAEAEDRVVTRAGSNPIQRGNGLLYSTLSGAQQDHNLQPLRVIVPAEREGDELYRHEGEEWLHLLSGRLLLRLDEREYVLEPGDSAHFDASKPHRLEALDDVDAELILVAAAVPHPLLRSYL